MDSCYEKVISINNLVKDYHLPIEKNGFIGGLKHFIHPQYFVKKAVDNIDFSISRGECVAFLGPNGAGKSTTIKMLTGILQPTSGSISVLNKNPFLDRMYNTKNIGVVFGQKTQLWWDIPLKETFLLLKDIYEISNEEYKKNMEIFCEILEIHRFLGQTVRKLSLGQRVRADIAAALLHNPQIVYLDEPTIGLDVSVKQKVYKFLRAINEQNNTTIMLTSHDLKDIENICQRIIIIDNGKIAYDGRMDNLFFTYPLESKIIVDYEKIIDSEIRMQNIDIIYKEKNRLIVTFDESVTSSTEVLKFLLQKVKVKNFNVINPSLDQVIINIFRKNQN